MIRSAWVSIMEALISMLTGSRGLSFIGGQSSFSLPVSLSRPAALFRRSLEFPAFFAFYDSVSRQFSHLRDHSLILGDVPFEACCFDRQTLLSLGVPWKALLESMSLLYR
jgi:hypothetical protein